MSQSNKTILNVDEPDTKCSFGRFHKSNKPTPKMVDVDRHQPFWNRLPSEIKGL